MRPFLVTLVHYHIGPPPRPHLVSATFLTLKRAKRFARKLAEDNHAVVVVEDTTLGRLVARVDARAPRAPRRKLA